MLIQLFALLTNESFNKQYDGYHIKYKQIENILPVFFQKRSKRIPFKRHKVFLGVQGWLYMKTCHPSNISRCVQKVLFRSLTV